MKRFIITVLAVALMAAPAWAAVTITDSNDGDEVTLSYEVTGPNNVRAFALDITVDSGAKITSISDLNTQYDIYPGSIVIVGGAVTSDGNAIGDSAIYAGTQGGLGTGGITIEMGSLYVGANEPATSGVLCKFVVDIDCNVSVAENVIRAGVVMENPDEDPGLSLPSPLYVKVAEPECLKSTIGAEYTRWVSYNSPDCWCYKKNCRGDADGQDTFFKPVAIADLNIFKAGFGKSSAEVKTTVYNGVPAICADFDRADTFFKPIAIADLNIFKAYFGLAHASVPCCDDDQDCVIEAGEKFNFWMN